MDDFQVIDSDSGEVRGTASSWPSAVVLSDHWLAKTRRAHHVKPPEVIDIRDEPEPVSHPGRTITTQTKTEERP